MQEKYFSELIPELSTRSSRATIGMLGFSSSPLRTFLREAFASSYGEFGSFLGDPVFEATFGWAQADSAMNELAGSLLTPELVASMDNPPEDLKADYRFPCTAHPYQHQVKAWKKLSEPTPQSVVVTSGTGSGKTECFMVPILNQLIQEQKNSGTKLIGVRALFLYPLNALINSQRDRLRAWTAAFDDKIRFCLYNGLTPNEEPAHRRKQVPNQVLDRKELRESPPPILVTNATMLEYMLVRAQDAPILQASRGKLQWIVLDEAHSYIGSQAAELSLLLRRVLHGFGVDPNLVRFVATSATIGDPDGEAGQKLAQFLADLAGVPLDRVHVISGSRSIPELPKGNPDYEKSNLESLSKLDVDSDLKPNRFSALCSNEFSNRIRRVFTAEGGKKPTWSLMELTRQLNGGQGTPQGYVQLLHWLDLLTASRRKTANGIEPFLPLRAHLFHQTLRGLWACANPICPCKKGTSLDSADWSFGMVFFDERRECECGAPIYELRSCNDCNTSLLWAKIASKGGKDFLIAPKESNEDEFELEVETSQDDQDRPDNEQAISFDQSVLVANHCIGGTAPISVARQTFEVVDQAANNTFEIRVRQAQILEDNTVLSCPSCGGYHEWDSQRMFRRAVLGAPFLLGQIIPTLLEFSPDGQEPLGSPYRGRRMISFTDSRQGTARIAAKIQQDSERNRVRGLVYRRAVNSASTTADTEREKTIRQSLEALRAVPKQPALDVLIAEKESELKELFQPKPISFGEVSNWLATNEMDVGRWMFDYYHQLDPEIFTKSTGREELAKMALAREFARRPKRLNSLETMGLVMVTYPKLANIASTPALPVAISLEEWKSFLKICLDFHVRENTFIDLPESWKKWGGNRISRKWLLPPTSQEKSTTSIRKWPQCRGGSQSSRLIRILSYGLKLDSSTATGRDTLDLLMRAAWDALCGIGLLQSSGDARRFLSFSDMSFLPITNGWMCPVTRKVLDTTFKSITPYLPSVPTDDNALCKAISFQQCPALKQEFNRELDQISAIREWVNNSSQITDLRDQGLWSDLHDRILEGAAYFRAAEHSAQQPAAKLQSYERDFKAGKLNLLSCSTTMEMGVDIGGISVVAMNNVPPHPANYLQRAGRAGRRGETRSVALTLCKNNPHDQHVFSNTRWPFDTPLPMPSISLSSAVIVQRHLNSMLLAHFLREGLGANDVDLNKLNCEWFFLPEEDCRAEKFIAWCENFLESQNEELSAGLRKLIARTCFEGAASLSSLTMNAALEMKRVQSRWMGEYRAIIAQLSWIPGANREKEPAFKALTIQSKRLTGEYLLTELATEGFLPGYGFPTDIASFDNLTIDEIKANIASKDHREDNSMRRRDLASRDRVTALREYAPGAEVVMDGMVYRSAGITLNWHAPADLRDISEIQNIRKAWRCKKCGTTGTAPNHLGTLQCVDCGADVEMKHTRTFLEPAGFAVDLYESAHNDVSQQQYIAMESPWVQAEGAWISMPNNALGRFRSTTNGLVFFHSSGPMRNGYAICLECGRAEPMPSLSSISGVDATVAHLPKIFQKPHWRLRGKQGTGTSECPGSGKPRAIQPNMHLGHEAHTDILEIQLKHLNGLYLNSPTVAFTLAVAIRDGIAETLGVESSEMGCETKQVKLEDGSYCSAILIYDHHASGYCSSVSAHLGDLLKKARDKLNCSKHCDSACQHCLLGYDNRLRFDDLDRHSALEFLTMEWLQSLKLPDELNYFGSSSAAEYEPLQEAVWRELGKPNSVAVKLHFLTNPSDWDIATSPAKRLIYRWLSKEKPVVISIPSNSLPTLSEENRFSLAALASHELIAVEENPPRFIENNGVILAEVVYSDHRVVWAVNNKDSGIFGPEWGLIEEHTTLIRGVLQDTQGEQVSTRLSAHTIRPIVTSNIELTIQHELDGHLQGFGERFWEKLIASSPELKSQLFKDGNEISSITYKDRYLSAPFTVALLLEVITKLRDAGVAAEQLPEVNIVTVAPNASERSKPPRSLWSDWQSESDRDEVVKAAFRWCGLDSRITSLEKNQADHARTMVLGFSSGVRIRIRFDQGVSYWQVAKDASRARGWDVTSFDFSNPIQEQAQILADLNLRMTGQSFPTYLWISPVGEKKGN